VEKEWPAYPDAQTRRRAVEKLESSIEQPMEDHLPPDFDLSDYINKTLADGTPEHFKDAINSPDAPEWIVAIGEEFDALKENKTWDVVDRKDIPDGRSTVKCRWVFTKKRDGRYKARLVVKGYTQIQGIDFDEVFAPVVSFEAVRILLAVAALEGWEIHGMDVKSAFLHGDLEEEIYMELPELPASFPPFPHSKVARLKKSLYGLRQAARVWSKKIHEALLELGFIRRYSDGGIYVYRQQEGDTDITVVLLLYVDDMLIMGNKSTSIEKLKSELKNRFKMTDLGQKLDFLGLDIIQEKETGSILINQRRYLVGVLERFGMMDSNPLNTPFAPGVVITENKETCDPETRTLFQQMIGSLLYGMIGSRPDIAYYVIRLARYCSNPSQHHVKLARDIMRYLRGTLDYNIKYEGKSDSGLIGFSDADWAENKDDRRSITGYVTLLANGAVTWVSRRQATVALSSTESEYMSASDACRHLCWQQTFLTELGFGPPPIPLCVDNQGAIFLASNPTHDHRTKHIDIRYHFIREKIEDDIIKLYHIPSEDQIADILTKSLSVEKFSKFISSLGIVEYGEK